MSGQYVLDEDGNPLPCDDLVAWGRWFETVGARRVAQDQIGDVRVSTVFLGLDHRFGSEGDPVLWETMIFGGPMDGEQRRYTSKAEALAGHRMLVTSVRLAQSV